MFSSLDEVEFLARSGTRIKVLDAIDEEPRTRNELKELTEVSRTTLSRMLSDFEERGWVSRPNRQYQLTPVGAFVVSEVTRLLENMETSKKLEGALRWLPTEEFDFDLRRLHEAEVVTLRWNDPASMRLLAERLDGARQVRSIATSVSREVMDILHKVTVISEASYEGILTTNAVQIVREHPELRDQLREILDSERTTVYRYDGDESLAMVMLIDDLATICSHGRDGPQMEAIIADDEAFHSWVETYFESICADAQILDADAFAT